MIVDQISGTVAKRPGLKEVKKILRDGESSRTIVMMQTLREAFCRDQDGNVAQLVRQIPQGHTPLLFQRLEEAETTLW